MTVNEVILVEDFEKNELSIWKDSKEIYVISPIPAVAQSNQVCAVLRKERL